MDDIVFNGNLSELFEKINSNEIEYNLPQSHEIPCKFITAYWVMAGIKNSIIIVHGPSGCAFGAKELRHHNTAYSGCEYDYTGSTNIDENSIIFGGEKKLEDSILEVDKKFNPDLIAVLTSCSSGIIGDDVDGVVAKIKNNLNSKIIVIKCEGFAGDFRCGYDEAYLKLMDLMEVGKTNKGTINILGTRKGPEPLFGSGEYKEITRLVQGIGLKINGIIAGGCTLDQIKSAGRVEANVAWCSDLGLRLGKHMEERFNIPYSVLGMPYGLNATREYLMEVGKYTNREKDAKEFIKHEEEKVSDILKETRRMVKGKKAIISLGPIRSIGLSRFLQDDLEMDVIIHNLHPFQLKERRNIVEHYISSNINPKVVITQGAFSFGMYNWMQQENLETRKVSDPESAIFFGSVYQFPGVPIANIDCNESFPHVGFNGIENICHYIQKGLKAFARPRSVLFRRALYGE